MSNSLNCSTIYERIVLALEEKYNLQLSQKSIGEILGVSEHLVGKWKKGILIPTLKTMKKVATLTGRSLQWLMAAECYISYGDINANVIDEFNETEGFTANFESANTLQVHVETTGLQGGDSGHGGRTSVTLKDLGNTSMGVKTRWDGKEVSIIVSGDTELTTLTYALLAAGESLKPMAGTPPNVTIISDVINQNSKQSPPAVAGGGQDAIATDELSRLALEWIAIQGIVSEYMAKGSLGIVDYDELQGLIRHFRQMLQAMILRDEARTSEEALPDANEIS